MRHTKMEINGNNYLITHPRNYSTTDLFSPEIINECFDFAYAMTFGSGGEHRNHRSGGKHRRKNGELFINTFQGKLAEYAIYTILNNNRIECPPPDTETYALGAWDSTDIEVSGNKINIKSSKFFANLLLLETKDWSTNGQYLPNIGKDGDGVYDFFIFVRIKPDGESLMKRNRLLYTNDTNESDLRGIIVSERWEYDIPGYIDREFLVRVINNRNIIPQGVLLNGRTRMDAENYYVQSGDMSNIEGLIEIL